MLVAAILAAGRSTRMGRDKLLLPLGGKPILRQVVDAVGGLEPAEIFVIVSPASTPALAATLAGTAARIVTNQRAGEGMGTSIARAVASLPPGAEILLLTQGDQPLVPTDALRRIVEPVRDAGKAFAAARFGEVVTTPVAFDRRLFAELRALGGDRGARGILDRHAGEGAVLDFSTSLGLDVDDEAGYRRAEEIWASRT